jgi:8-oxo-dGTP pyrophosphatase MutT (NUDIX family)
MKSPRARTAAVTLLFSDYGDEPYILLIKRAETLSRHRGEWAFPGGSIEAGDESLLDTALRETEEEIGIDRNDIEVWGPLDAVVTSTGYVVWPFGGLVSRDVPLMPDSGEVAEVTKMPLSVIVEPQAERTITRLDAGAGREYRAYSYDGRIIWGATARMLSQVAETMRQVVPASASGSVGEGSRRFAGGNGD